MENHAGRWFAIRAEYERVRWPGMVRRYIKEFALAFVSLSVVTPDLKIFCDVFIVRRDTGAAVAAFSYSHISEATHHVEDLRSRLASTQVFDFCRELRIGVTAVAGPGTERQPLVTWLPIPARSRGVSSNSAEDHGHPREVES